MNEDTLKGQWKQFVGSVKEKWAELTDDELTEIDGNREKLLGKIQERYGHAKEEVEKQLDEWSKKHDFKW